VARRSAWTSAIQALTTAGVDVPRMVELVGDGVLARVAAAVVGAPVVGASLHLALAESADDEAVQRERLGGGTRLARHRAPSARGGESAHSPELLVGHERLVGERLGDDPGVLVVPAHLADVAERDVFHVEEHLVAALAVPHLTSVVGVDLAS